jgi:hypothetical protein
LISGAFNLVYNAGSSVFNYLCGVNNANDLDEAERLTDSYVFMSDVETEALKSPEAHLDYNLLSLSLPTNSPIKVKEPELTALEVETFCQSLFEFKLVCRNLFRAANPLDDELNKAFFGHLDEKIAEWYTFLLLPKCSESNLGNFALAIIFSLQDKGANVFDTTLDAGRIFYFDTTVEEDDEFNIPLKQSKSSNGSSNSLRYVEKIVRVFDAPSNEEKSREEKALAVVSRIVGVFCLAMPGLTDIDIKRLALPVTWRTEEGGVFAASVWNSSKKMFTLLQFTLPKAEDLALHSYRIQNIVELEKQSNLLSQLNQDSSEQQINENSNIEENL